MNRKLNHNRKAKIIILVILSLFAFLILFDILIQSGLILKFFPKDENDKSDYIYFCDADYEFDIFSDEEYLDLDRYIKYSDDGFSTVSLVNDNAFKNAGKIAIFWGEYFDSVIYGDYDKYNSFFTESYIADKGKKEKFTMQMLYNIEVVKLREYEDGESTVYEFEVRYAIRHNNGTFRDDIESDATRPQIYQLIQNSNTNIIKINIISDYNYKN